MTQKNVLPVTFKLSQAAKDGLECAFSKRYTSFSEGVRGVLEEWLLKDTAQTTQEELKRLETALEHEIKIVRLMRQNIENQIIEVKL